MFLKCKSIYNCDCIHTHLLQLPFSVHRGGRGHEVSASRLLVRFSHHGSIIPDLIHRYAQNVFLEFWFGNFKIFIAVVFTALKVCQNLLSLLFRHFSDQFKSCIFLDLDQCKIKSQLNKHLSVTYSHSI
jgi:hypothetical protein